MAPTSYPMALASLVLLPFDVVSTVARFWIRFERKAWGPDDWAMLANIPFWIVSMIATVGMAWSGVGAYDGSLSEQQRVDSLMQKFIDTRFAYNSSQWFYIFQEPWCFTLITIKWSIGFALVRIANGNKWIEYVIYICLGFTTLVMGGTGMYLFFQCMPVQKNWYTDLPGTCQHRSIQTVLSYAVAVVSITTDWIFAVLPVFLLWNVQLDPRVKASVVGLLGLGVFASIAPIVRLHFLIGMNDQTRFLENLGAILAWASAEMNVGMLVANLPACRPLLERALSHMSSWTNSAVGRRLSQKDKTGATRPTVGVNKTYLELDERPESKNLKSYLSSHGNKSGAGIETRIYGRDLDNDSILSLDRDDGSQKRIVEVRGSGSMHVNVQKDFYMEIDDGKPQGGRKGVEQV